MLDDGRPGWGILATGGIADAFVRDLRGAGRHIAAVGSRTAERAREFAASHDIPVAHGSWSDLAADPDVDVVYIATPHPAHAGAARAMLEAGKHVLIEKPYTLNEAEARAVQGLAAERGLVALEAMWTRWLPHMLEIHEIIESGLVGEPQMLILDHTQALPDDPAHRVNDPALGGGALLDLGVYPISFAVDLFGEPDVFEVAARMGPTGVDRAVSGVLVHADGQHTVFTTASDLAGPNRAEILGTAGSISIGRSWNSPAPFTVFDRNHEVVRTSTPEVAGRGMQYQALAAERLIATGERDDPRMSASDTLAVMRTMDRIRAAIGLVYPQEAAG